VSGVTVVLCVKNGEKTVRRCLAGVSWADEIVVVDDCSTDDTVRICREFTDRVEVRKMTAGFSEQRRYALSLARGPWIISVDADDEVPPELAEELRRRVQENGSGYSAFRVMRQTSYLGRWMRYCGWRSPMTALFRKDAARYDGKLVHENLIIAGKTGDLKHQMRHHAYESLSEHFRRMDLYTTYDALTFQEKGVVLRPLNYPFYFCVKPALAFFRKYVLMQGYREGVRGLFISVVTSFVVFMNYAKLWELQCARDRAKKNS
jgi:glycosyltransferase involved in cell wall biosynthesis